MNTQALSPQGYNINDAPMNTNPFWEIGKYQVKVNIYVDDSPIEPGFDFVFKSIDGTQINRVTSHYGYVTAQLDICTVYDLQPINGTKYFLDRHELIYMNQPVDLETSRYLTTAAQPVTDIHPVVIRYDGTGTPNSTLTRIDDAHYTLTLSDDDVNGFLLGLNETDTDPVYSLTLPTSFAYNFACTAFLVEGRLFFIKTGGVQGQFEYASFTITYDNVTYTINVQ